MLEARLNRLGEFLERTRGEVMTTTVNQEHAVRATVTTPTDREIRIERIFNASRDRVWQAFTDPELVAQWWGRGNKVVIERMEVKRGGHWRFVEHSAHGVHGFEGRYREVTPRSASFRRSSGTGCRATWSSRR